MKVTFLETRGYDTAEHRRTPVNRVVEMDVLPREGDGVWFKLDPAHADPIDFTVLSVMWTPEDREEPVTIFMATCQRTLSSELNSSSRDDWIRRLPYHDDAAWEWKYGQWLRKQ